MTSTKAYQQTKLLLQKAGIQEAALEARWIFEEAAGACRHDIAEVSPAQYRQMQQMAEKRCQGIPLQYVLGSWPFLDIDLKVGPGVLCPRPETEEVCLAGVEMLEKAQCPSPVIADLCAGSGAIALGLLSRIPNARIQAVEWSSDAFSYLDQNEKAYYERSGKHVELVYADVLQWHKTLEDDSYDLIISNPPYISAQEYQGLSKEVKAEPEMALVAPEEGLAFYKAIARDYRTKLKPRGSLVFEIGYQQGEDLEKILQQCGYVEAEIRCDMNGNPRIALAVRGG